MLQQQSNRKHSTFNLILNYPIEIKAHRNIQRAAAHRNLLPAQAAPVLQQNAEQAYHIGAHLCVPHLRLLLVDNVRRGVVVCRRHLLMRHAQQVVSFGEEDRARRHHHEHHRALRHNNDRERGHRCEADALAISAVNKE